MTRVLLFAVVLVPVFIAVLAGWPDVAEAWRKRSRGGGGYGGYGS